jgi:hypothetical protein
MTTKRLQLDVDPRLVREIDQLQRAMCSPSRAELIRSALKLLQWFFREVKEGGTFIVEKNGQQYVVAFPFLPLDSADSQEHRSAPALVDTR